MSAADDLSSLLAIGVRQREEFPGTAERTTTKVDVRRLDGLLKPNELKSPVLLKIDVQGGELAVLQGAEAILPSIDAVLAEVSLVELYTGQALTDAVWDHLRRHGSRAAGSGP